MQLDGSINNFKRISYSSNKSFWKLYGRLGREEILWKFRKIYLWKINSEIFKEEKNKTFSSFSFRENPILKKFPISFEFFLYFLRIREKPYRRRDTDVLKKKAIASPFRPDCLFKEADGSKVVRAEVTSLDEERLGKKEKKRRA